MRKKQTLPANRDSEDPEDQNPLTGVANLFHVAMGLFRGPARCPCDVLPAPGIFENRMRTSPL